MTAPWILWRYILREVGLYTLLGLSAFALLLVVANLLKDLELLQIIGGDVTILGRLMLVLLPAYITYIVPTALLFGVLLAFARFSSDGEWVAMRASGLSMIAVLPPVAALGLVSVAITAYVSFDLEPRSHHQLKTLRRDLLSTHSVLTPGRVRPMGAGRTLYVAETGDEQCPLKGVVISDFTDKQRPYYVAASCGAVVDLETEGLVALDLVRGAVHFSEAGPDRYDRMEFAGSRLQLDLDSLDFFRKKLNHYTFGELLGPMIGSNYSRPRIDTEIQRRLSFPLAGLLLALLAVPLGVRPVRRGRSAGAVTAVGVVALYWCLFTATQVLADRELMPPWVLWLPNLGIASLIAVLLRLGARSES